ALDLLDQIGQRLRLEALDALRRHLVFRAPLLFPLPLQRRVRGDRDQPAAERRLLAQARQLGEQLERDGLKDVGGVLAARAVFQRNGKNQVAVLVEQRGPRAIVALQTAADEARIAPRAVRTTGKTQRRWIAGLIARHRKASRARTAPRRSRARDGRNSSAADCPALSF